MTNLYRRNKQFKKDLPLYRFALRKWMWQGKKKMTRNTQSRYEIVLRLENLIFDWQTHAFFPLTLIIEPPDKQIKEVLSWPT